MSEPDGRIAMVGPLGKAFLERVIRDSDVQAGGAELCQKCPILARLFDGEFPVGTQRRRTVRDRPLQTHAKIGHSEAKKYWRGPPRPSDPIRPRVPTVDSPPTFFSWDHKWPVTLDGDELAEILSSENATDPSYWRHPYKRLITDATLVLADRLKRFFDLLRGGQLVAEGIRRETGQELEVSRKEWDRPDRYLHVQNSDLFNKTGERFSIIWESLTLQSPNRQATAGRSAKAPSPPTSHGEEKTVAPRKPGRKQTVGPRIEEAMRLDIKERRETPESLAAMLEKQMAVQYRASRDTCRKARMKVLLEFNADK
jgi:hypothetical protein